MTTTEGITEPAVLPSRSRRRLVVAGIVTLALFAAAIAIGKLSPQPVHPPSANVGTQLDAALPAAIARRSKTTSITCSVSGRGIRTSGVTSKSKPQNS